MLAGIFQALGAERINVEDFELDHVSAERGGTLTMLVAGEGEADRAADLLEQQGYGVVAAPVIDEMTRQPESGESSRCRGSSGISPSPATSRSRTARS